MIVAIDPVRRQAIRKPVGFMAPISGEIYKNMYINKGLVQCCCLFIKAVVSKRPSWTACFRRHCRSCLPAF